MKEPSHARSAYILMTAAVGLMGAAMAAPAQSAPLVGYYLEPSSEQNVDDQFAQSYKSFDSTVVEYRVYSDFPDRVWKVVEDRFEDSTAVAVVGPGGVLFRIDEGGGDWGYSNQGGLSLFFFDHGDRSPDQKITNGQAAYPYDALIVNHSGVKAYRCVFQTSRLRDAVSSQMMKQPYDPDKPLFRQIGRYLSINGVDVSDDKCMEGSKFLHKDIVDLQERALAPHD